MTEKSPESYSEVKISYRHPSPPNQAEVTEMPKSQKQSPRSAKPTQMNRKTRHSPKEKPKNAFLDI